MVRLGTLIAVVGMVCVLAGADTAAAGGTAFVADALQTFPNGAAQRGRLFVGPAGMRFESGAGPRQTIEIVLPKQKLTRILLPSEKVYFERPGAVPMPTDRPAKPCRDMAGLTCEKVGTDKLDDTNTEKWRAQVEGAPGGMMMWWDPARKMILRQEYPDGRVMHMTRRGTENYEGRTVERWDVAYTTPAGPMWRAVHLYDAKLGVSVHETSPDGMMRRLSNIKETAADPKWFEVPDDYRKIESPQPPAPPAGAGAPVK